MPNKPCALSTCPAEGTVYCCPVHRPDKVIQRAKDIVVKHLDSPDHRVALLRILSDLDATI